MSRPRLWRACASRRGGSKTTGPPSRRAGAPTVSTKTGATGAARVVATGLALDYYFRGEHAVVNGWIRRAHRLLEGIEQCPELGWLSIVEAHIALRVDHDPATAQVFSARAVALGRSLGDIDLEMLALAYEGCTPVDQGKIAEGMHCLNEAAAAAVAGEMSNLFAISMTYCCVIYACERVRDAQGIMRALVVLDEALDLPHVLRQHTPLARSLA